MTSEVVLQAAEECVKLGLEVPTELLSELARVRNTPIITAQQKGSSQNPCGEVPFTEWKFPSHEWKKALQKETVISLKPSDYVVPSLEEHSSGIHQPFGVSYRRRAKFEEFMDGGKTETVLFERHCIGFVIKLIKKRTWSSDEGKYEGVRYWRYIEDGSVTIDHTFESFKDFERFEESMRLTYIRRHKKTKPTTVKVETGISSLDRELARMPLGSLVLITGNAGAGKTLLAHQIYRTVAKANQWKAGTHRFCSNHYSSFRATVNNINAHQHLVVFDDLMITRPFDDLSLLQDKLKNTKLIDWVILTVQTNRQNTQESFRLADYIFNIEKYSAERFHIKCLKNRWGTSHPHGINVKIKTTAHLEEV